MKILIIDDERLARERLKDLLRDNGEQHVLLEAGSGVAGIHLAQSEHPDAVLLDIRMPGMDGLETAWHLSTLDPSPAVIFTTAYDDRAVEAFESRALDYLLKPIRGERLQEALRRARAFNQANASALMQADTQRRVRTHISVRDHAGLQLIPVEEIRYLKADQKYICVGWSGREVLIDERLKALEEEFGDRFLRIHRGALVALAHVEGLERRGDGTFCIRLSGIDEPLAVSRRLLPDVRRAIKALGKRER